MYDLKVENIRGESVAMSEYKGKVLLISNTASGCGFTPQYGEFQKLYETYQSQGLEILAFPSNDFGQQEPLSNDKIAEFCDLRFKAKYPLFAKTTVKGSNKNPLFDHLIQQSPIDKGQEIKWNFEKFLVDKNGKVVGRFSSKVSPLDDVLKSQIETLLK